MVLNTGLCESRADVRTRRCNAERLESRDSHFDHMAGNFVGPRVSSDALDQPREVVVLERCPERVLAQCNMESERHCFSAEYNLDSARHRATDQDVCRPETTYETAQLPESAAGQGGLGVRIHGWAERQSTAMRHGVQVLCDPRSQTVSWWKA